METPEQQELARMNQQYQQELANLPPQQGPPQLQDLYAATRPGGFAGALGERPDVLAQGARMAQQAMDASQVGGGQGGPQSPLADALLADANRLYQTMLQPHTGTSRLWRDENNEWREERGHMLNSRQQGDLFREALRQAGGLAELRSRERVAEIGAGAASDKLNSPQVRAREMAGQAYQNKLKETGDSDIARQEFVRVEQDELRRLGVAPQSGQPAAETPEPASTYRGFKPEDIRSAASKAKTADDIRREFYANFAQAHPKQRLQFLQEATSQRGGLDAIVRLLGEEMARQLVRSGDMGTGPYRLQSEPSAGAFGWHRLTGPGIPADLGADVTVFRRMFSPSARGTAEARRLADEYGRMIHALQNPTWLHKPE
jgi:hypothetical protein